MLLKTIVENITGVLSPMKKEAFVKKYFWLGQYNSTADDFLKDHFKDSFKSMEKVWEKIRDSKYFEKSKYIGGEQDTYYIVMNDVKYIVTVIVFTGDIDKDDSNIVCVTIQDAHMNIIVENYILDKKIFMDDIKALKNSKKSKEAYMGGIGTEIKQDKK